MRTAHFNQMAWPIPDEEMDQLNHCLRYGTPSRSDILAAASVLSAYRALVMASQEKRATVVRGIKNGWGDTAAPPSADDTPLTLVAHNDGPWPLRDVVARLADAADHLLRDHGCDDHGHEETAYARDAARQILADPAASVFQDAVFLAP